MLFNPSVVPKIIGLASNVRGGPNPPYGAADFAAMYPQFFTDGDGGTVPLVPANVLDEFITVAHACVKHSRFGDLWRLCMGLFVAHFTTLYMESMIDPDGGVAQVAAAGRSGGLLSSKSVDGVSVSYDYTQIMSDLEGWAEWKETVFGLQLATFAKMLSLGGMYVH